MEPAAARTAYNPVSALMSASYAALPSFTPPPVACYDRASPLMRQIIDAIIPVQGKGTVPQELLATLNDSDQFRLAVGGKEIFGLIAETVRTATREVLIQTFTWDSKIPAIEWLNDALKEAAKNKEIERRSNSLAPPVRVYILIDERGPLANLFFNGSFSTTKWPCTPESLNLFHSPGLVEIYPATYSHNSPEGNHAKTVVVDNRSVIITGANFQASNFGHLPSHDAAFLFQGPVAQAARADFLFMWNSSKRKEELPSVALLNESPTASLFPDAKRPVPVLFATRVPQAVANPIPLDNPLSCSFVAAIQNAKTIVQIATPNLNESLVCDALVDFINTRNGTVQLLLGKGFNDKREAYLGMGGSNQATIDSLYRHIEPGKHKNLNARWHSLDGQSPLIGNVAGACHLKFMAVDCSLTIFGNANLDKISLANLHEDNVIIDDPETTIMITSSVFTHVFERGVPAEKTASLPAAAKEYLGWHAMMNRLAPAQTMAIQEIRQEGNGFRTIRLERPAGWNFKPGQYVEITSGNILSEVFKEPAIMAIASGINDPFIEITARSSILPWHKNHALGLPEGSTLKVRGPIGTSFPVDTLPPEVNVLLLGGGSGLTPIRSMMRGLPGTANCTLCYSAKTRDDLLYRAEVESWRTKGHRIALTQENVDGYAHGRISLGSMTISDNTIACLCGPESMIRALVQELVSKGLPRIQIFASLPKLALEGGPVFRADHPRLL